MHVGTNDLREKKTTKEIATNIIEFDVDMKTEKKEIMVSGIISRYDKYNVKGSEVNNFLISLCSKYNFHFIDNSNINVNHSKHKWLTFN